MREVARGLSECSEDVFVFQEVWTAEVRKILVDGGRRAGHPDHFRPADGGGGLHIISLRRVEHRTSDPLHST